MKTVGTVKSVQVMLGARQNKTDRRPAAAGMRPPMDQARRPARSLPRGRGDAPLVFSILVFHGYLPRRSGDVPTMGEAPGLLKMGGPPNAGKPEDTVIPQRPARDGALGREKPPLSRREDAESWSRRRGTPDALRRAGWPASSTSNVQTPNPRNRPQGALQHATGRRKGE